MLKLVARDNPDQRTPATIWLEVDDDGSADVRLKIGDTQQHVAHINFAQNGDGFEELRISTNRFGQAFAVDNKIAQKIAVGRMFAPDDD